MSSIVTSVVVFDLEFTAWEGSMARNWSGPGEHREVVQFGAVRLHARTLAEEAQFEALVRPRINPQLSDYFTRLTGITNAAVAARGTDFLPAYRAFLEFAGVSPLACFGTDDQVLAENIGLYGLSGNVPAPPRAINLHPWLEGAGVDLDGLHSGQVAWKLGLAFDGRIHDALDDARSLALVLRHMRERGVRLPPQLG